jgi:hypothetical protein
MDTDQLIVKLKESGLLGECPGGYRDFKLSNAVLFDGTGPFPDMSLGNQLQPQSQLTEQEKELKRKTHA